MTERTTAGPRLAAPVAETQDPTIRPFHVRVPEEDLAELCRRVQATHWPEKETVTARKQVRGPVSARGSTSAMP